MMEELPPCLWSSANLSGERGKKVEASDMGMLCMLDPGTHGTGALSLHGHMPFCTGLLLENA